MAEGPTASATRSPALALVALAMGGFTIGTTEFTSMSLLPQMAAGLQIDAPTAGHVISAYALGVVVGAPLLAVIGARVARKRLLVVFMAMIAAFNALSAIAPSYGTMLAARFLSGLPHGAYFGVASLVAASLVPDGQRARAVSRMFLGLTTATIAGVPLANVIGQVAGWRWGYGLVAALGLLTIALLAMAVPRGEPDRAASPLRELGALKRAQVWLTLAIGAVGFGGMFCVYTYLASTMAAVTGASPGTVPVALASFGVGMTLGTIVCGWGADRALMPAAGVTLAFSAAALALYAPAAHHLATLLLVVVPIGGGVGLGTILQTRLMDVSGDAQVLPAALNHSAFNTANALGPWLGGLAIAAGWGWTSTGWVGVALALGGLAIWAIAWRLERRGA